ncbi:MAG: class I SAM-dependent methyltransferase [Deltaproteobacteria bacterium]|nr:class I SAM-dependent methyltransferase [Deltaproteobacteria bacterium]
MNRARRLQETRESWNFATRLHNAHKRDQAGFLRSGGSTLFPEELALLGDLTDRRLLHVLSNAGQDTLSLAARGARAVGVDLSDEAIAFARDLSVKSGIPATFHRGEILEVLESDLEPEPFDVVFGSYGCLVWIEDLARFFRGVFGRLARGGRLVIVEFHPIAWSFGDRFELRDPYFASGQVFSSPVGDYVGEAGGALSPSGHLEAPPISNPHAAHAYQHPVGSIVSHLLDAGFVLEALREWPYANGCRLHPGLVRAEGQRFTTPPAVPNLPLMLGLAARRPQEAG